MDVRCSCGAVPPSDARFCHKCGRPLREEDIPVVEEAAAPVAVAPVAVPVAPAKKLGINFHNSIAVRVAFLAAGLTTLLALMPFPAVVSALWQVVMLVAGGFYATYLYSRRTGESLTVSAGARMGWLTGIFAFVIVTVVSTISMVALSAGDNVRNAFHKMAENSPAAESVDRLLQSDAGIATFLLISLAGTFIMWTILAIVGGALGAKVLEKD